MEQRADALLVEVDALFNYNGELQIVALAAQHRLPTDEPGLWASASRLGGGLISHGVGTTARFEPAGWPSTWPVRPGGEKPADLPVSCSQRISP